MSITEPQPGAGYDAAEMSRLVLATAAAGGADTRKLAREAGLPDWALADRQAMVSSAHMFRLWERAEHALADPFLGLAAASRHRLGDLDLYDYLFTTAATVERGLAASQSFAHLVSTNGHLQAKEGADGDITYSYQHTVHGGRGEDICLQFVIAGYCSRIRAATSGLVTPARVQFAQPAPRSHRAFTETLGTTEIDFETPATTFTLRAADRGFPMPKADQVLAGILQRIAASQSAPRLASWREHVQDLLAEAIEHGAPTLDALARRLAVSRRTLQRQFAEHGTTWRTELDTARRRRAGQAHQTGSTSIARLAHQLGYSDPRSARNALQRWNQPGSQAGLGSGA